MSGKKGPSGRKRTATTLVSQALDSVDQRLPDIFNALIDKAVGHTISCPKCGTEIDSVRGDRDSQIYLIDRRLGKPKATTEIESSTDKALTALAVTQLLNVFEQRRREVEASVITQDAASLLETNVITGNLEDE